MALSIIELFGYEPADTSLTASLLRTKKMCPFISTICSKQFRDGEPAGVCAVRQSSGQPVICCPNRLYANNYEVLQKVADTAFGVGTTLARPSAAKTAALAGIDTVAVFGHYWGKELRLPASSGASNYFVDWILALLNAKGELVEFVAVEVQTIDTTGSYRSQRDAILAGNRISAPSQAGLNWENVNKRILPQLIYKGHVLRREPLCKKGLFFICPSQVLKKARDRLGTLQTYHMQAGSITFRAYDISVSHVAGKVNPLVPAADFTTTVDQVANAFSAGLNLPPAGVYEQAIKSEL